MVKVVFSNGSKAMAHNLDDQYQRWQIRREELAKDDPYVNPERDLELFVPELPEMNDYAEVLECRDVVRGKHALLQVKLAELNAVYRQNEIVRGEYDMRRAPIVVATSRLNQQLTTLKNMIDATERAQRRENLKAIKVASNSAIDSAKAVKTITRLKIKEKDGTLSPQDRIELETARFAHNEASLDGMEAAMNDALDEQDYKQRRDSFIDNLRKSLISAQEKLIAAYERIIELEAER